MKSYSQINQEKFVIDYFNGKENGIFIELGGLDGVRHSNTFLLEFKYGWKGLIIEPSPSLYEELSINRKVYTENFLIGKEDKDSVEFLYIKDKSKCIGLQGVVQNYNPKHVKRINRELGKDYKYEIIKLKMTTLQNLCEKYGLLNIDYLSLDVEGSELQVLQGIDFDKINIKLIGVEINYKEDEEEIFHILEKNKYKFLKRQGDYFFEKK